MRARGGPALHARCRLCPLPGEMECALHREKDDHARGRQDIEPRRAHSSPEEADRAEDGCCARFQRACRSRRRDAFAVSSGRTSPATTVSVLLPLLAGASASGDEGLSLAFRRWGTPLIPISVAALADAVHAQRWDMTTPTSNQGKEGEINQHILTDWR